MSRYAHQPDTYGCRVCGLFLQPGLHKLFVCAVFQIPPRRLAAPDMDSESSTGIQRALVCFQKHADIRLVLFPVIEHFSRSHWLTLFSSVLPAVIPSSHDLLAFLHDLLPSVRAASGATAALTTDGVIDWVLDYSMTAASDALRAAPVGTGVAARGTSGSSTVPADTTLMAALQLLAQVWADFAAHMEARAELTKEILALLRRGCRHASRSVKMSTLGSLFHLLEAFTVDHNRHAPFVYQALVFSLIEHYGDDALRHFIEGNFTQCLPILPSLPVQFPAPVSWIVSLLFHFACASDIFLELSPSSLGCVVCLSCPGACDDRAFVASNGITRLSKHRL
jgi:hypothetical protein